jgi:hypothetical protein
VARALIVGCGCRGQALGSCLLDAGWQVRGTTRDPARAAAAIESAGIEPAIADPDRLMTLLDQIEDVTLVFWLLGSARGESEAIAALHGPRLERLLEEIVDSPVRGFVYEAFGPVERDRLEAGSAIVREAGARWRIPFEIVTANPAEHQRWLDAMAAAAERLTTPERKS